MLNFISKPEHCHRDGRARHPRENHRAGGGTEPRLPNRSEQDNTDDKSREVGKIGQMDSCAFHFTHSFPNSLHDQLATQHSHLALKAVLASFVGREFQRHLFAFGQ